MKNGLPHFSVNKKENLSLNYISNPYDYSSTDFKTYYGAGYVHQLSKNRYGVTLDEMTRNGNNFTIYTVDSTNHGYCSYSGEYNIPECIYAAFL